MLPAFTIKIENIKLDEEAIGQGTEESQNKSSCPCEALVYYHLLVQRCSPTRSSPDPLLYVFLNETHCLYMLD